MGFIEIDPSQLDPVGEQSAPSGFREISVDDLDPEGFKMGESPEIPMTGKDYLYEGSLGIGRGALKGALALPALLAQPGTWALKQMGVIPMTAFETSEKLVDAVTPAKTVTDFGQAVETGSDILASSLASAGAGSSMTAASKGLGAMGKVGKFLSAGSTPVGLGLPAAGGAIGEYASDSPWAPVVGSLAGGLTGPAASKLSGALVDSGKALQRGALGLSAGNYRSSLLKSGLSADEAGNLTTKLKKAADTIIDEGTLPKRRTANSVLNAVETQRQDAGKVLGNLVSQADEAGAKVDLTLSKAEEFIKGAPANQRAALKEQLDDFKDVMLDPESGWDGTLKGLHEVKKNIGADAYKKTATGYQKVEIDRKLQQAIERDINGIIDGTVDSDAWRAANKKYGNYKTLADALKNNSTKGESGDLVKLLYGLQRSSGGLGVPLILGLASGSVLPLTYAGALGLATHPWGRNVLGSAMRKAGGLADLVAGPQSVGAIAPYLSRAISQATETESDETPGKSGETSVNSVLNKAHTLNPSPVSLTNQKENKANDSKALSRSDVDRLGQFGSQSVQVAMEKGVRDLMKKGMSESQAKEEIARRIMSGEMDVGSKELAAPKMVSASRKVPEKLVNAVIYQESRGKKNAVSPKGAQGLMQLMPKTGRWLMEKVGLDPKDYDPMDAELNKKLGTFYLGYLIDKFKNQDLALIAYNWGEGHLKNLIANKKTDNPKTLIAHVPAETRNYVTKINKYLA